MNRIFRIILIPLCCLPLTLRAEAQPDGSHTEASHGEERHAVRLTEAQLDAHGIRTAEAAPGTVARDLALPGVLAVNADRAVILSARIRGTVTELPVTQGQSVRRGDTLAVLTSTEAAELRLACRRADLALRSARLDLNRERALWERRATAEADLQRAQAAAEQADLDLQSATARLRAAGLETGSPAPERVELKADADATVLDRPVTAGDAVDGGTRLLSLADLSLLWADLRAAPGQAAAIRPGMTVRFAHGGEGTVERILPTLDPATRTATVRVLLPNPDGRFRPGDYVTGTVRTEAAELPVTVPAGAVQQVFGGPAVFVRTADGAFEPRPVTVGSSDRIRTEIRSGLHAGETVAAEGAFTLKAELSKQSFGDGHNH